MLIGFVIGFVVGSIAVGVLAHRKPAWFAQVVAVANAVDDKVKTTVQK